MYFSIFNILPVVYVAIGVAVVAMLWLIIPYRIRITIRQEKPLKRAAKPDDTAEATVAATDTAAEAPAEEVEAVEEAEAEKLPRVTVIVYALYNAEALERMLPAVLGQDYPGGFDIIVVNDGSAAEVSDVVKRLSQTYDNLYQTFVPEEAHNLSRKKLSVSLGIKAAKTDYVVLTTADCVPCSLNWLRLMARHFTEGKEVVLGWGRISGMKSAMASFDQVATGATWLKAALNGHPYRGTAFNIAYTRDIFFRAKGFARNMNFTHGDDDLFIRQIATGENTAVELSAEARVSVRCNAPLHMWHELKLRHAFTGRHLPKGPRLFMGFSTLTMWLWVAAVAVAAVFSIPNLLPSCVLVALIPALWIPLTRAWRTTGRTLGVKLPAIFLWWLMLWRWVPDLKAQFLCNRGERRNFTWHQK